MFKVLPLLLAAPEDFEAPKRPASKSSTFCQSIKKINQSIKGVQSKGNRPKQVKNENQVRWLPKISAKGFKFLSFQLFLLNFSKLSKYANGMHMLPFVVAQINVLSHNLTSCKEIIFECSKI